MMPDADEVTILLVEDDEIDRRDIQEAFKQHLINNPFTVANDGVEALEILRGESGKPKLPRPYLILLDLKMPRMTGHEFLDEIRRDEELCDSVVFVLTTSDDDKDKTAAWKNNVAAYLLKESVGDDFLEALRMLKSYVLSVQFPRDAESE